MASTNKHSASKKTKKGGKHDKKKKNKKYKPQVSQDDFALDLLIQKATKSKPKKKNAKSKKKKGKGKPGKATTKKKKIPRSLTPPPTNPKSKPKSKSTTKAKKRKHSEPRLSILPVVQKVPVMQKVSRTGTMLRILDPEEESNNLHQEISQLKHQIAHALSSQQRDHAEFERKYNAHQVELISARNENFSRTDHDAKQIASLKAAMAVLREKVTTMASDLSLKSELNEELAELTIDLEEQVETHKAETQSIKAELTEAIEEAKLQQMRRTPRNNSYVSLKAMHGTAGGCCSSWWSRGGKGKGSVAMASASVLDTEVEPMNDGWAYEMMKTATMHDGGTATMDAEERCVSPPC